MSSENYQKNKYLYKRIINEKSKTKFKRRLCETSWNTVKGLDNPNEFYLNLKKPLRKFMMTVFQKLNSK